MIFLLILLPLFWILRFKDYKFGFVAVVSSAIFLNASLAIALQSFGQFKFVNLLILHILVGIVSIYFNFALIKKKFFSIKNCNLKLVPWVFLFSISIIFTQLYNVHYNYSGELSTLSGVEKVENYNSGYPYFSDEWIAIGMSEQSIETKKLPLTNFLNGLPFVNFLFVFHSFISSIDLILNVDLLNFYNILSISFSLIFISFVYIFLRGHKISVWVSILTIFLISYLPNSSNLPILWYLLPWNIGILFLVAYFVSVHKRYLKTAGFFNIVSIIFYPPIAILAIPSFLTLFFHFKEKKDKLILFTYVAIIFVSIFIAGFFISFFGGVDFSKVLKIIIGFVDRPLNSALGQPPLFIVWRVVSWFAVPFALLGFLKKKTQLKYISVPVLIGLIMWFLYASGFDTFFMDYHRVVAITSIFLLIFSAFGFEILNDYLKHQSYKNLFTYFILMIFFLLSFSFTQRDGWKNFTTINFAPAPPANNYLSREDVELFKDIKGQVFLSVPWKGLTLAVATKNMPVLTKPSTLTVNKVDYLQFLNFSCKEKRRIADKFGIKYVYSKEFKCPGFNFMGKSSEGFSLYLVK